jgi:hypothetical protein
LESCNGAVEMLRQAQHDTEMEVLNNAPIVIDFA